MTTMSDSGRLRIPSYPHGSIQLPQSRNRGGAAQGSNKGDGKRDILNVSGDVVDYRD